MNNSKKVAEFRKRRKKWAIESLGGSCCVCGYNKVQEALEFHHLDPSQKEFAPSQSGKTMNRLSYVNELRKCVLLCANHHREVHAGAVEVPSDAPRFNEEYATKKLPEKPKHPCATCGKLTPTSNKYCSIKCSDKNRERSQYPEDVLLLEEVNTNGYRATGRKYGVSDNAIRKRLKVRGLI